MTKLTADYSDTPAGVTSTYTFDFSYDLPGGDTITGASWTLVVVSGTDSSPSSRLIGAPTINGALVSQQIGNTPAGVRYAVRALATTSGGNSISIFSHLRSV